MVKKTKKPHFMRIPKELLRDLDGCKIAKRESYAQVVKRLMDKERMKCDQKADVFDSYMEEDQLLNLKKRRNKK